MTSVRVIANFLTETPNRVHTFYNRHAEPGYRWRDLEFTQDDRADISLILNHPLRFERYDPAQAVIMQMEPLMSIYRFPFPFNIPIVFEHEFLKVFDTIRNRNVCDIHISPSHVALLSGAVDLSKSKQMSAVISGLRKLPGQRLRTDFLTFLSERLPFDLYGRGHGEPGKRGQATYCGELPSLTKDAGLFPYQYTIAIENSMSHNYFTEKLTDALLSETLCFYWGCPNVSSFIDPRAFVQLDLFDFGKSFDIITQAIQNDEWSKRLPFIRAEKERFLTELAPIPTLHSLLVAKLRTVRTLQVRPSSPAIHFLHEQMRWLSRQLFHLILAPIAQRVRRSHNRTLARRPTKIIVIIPYRDRQHQLEQLIPALELQFKHQDFHLVICEQHGSGVFNKGRLINSAFNLFRDDDAYFCVHDVDLAPVPGACDYSFPLIPTQLCRPPHFMFYGCTGGVTLYSKEDFITINGYSNEYWGWGAEDDDVRRRIRLSSVRTWKKRYGRFQPLEETPMLHSAVQRDRKRIHNPFYAKNLARLGTALDDCFLTYDWRTEGLSSLNCPIVFRRQSKNCTHILVDVGEPDTAAR